MATLLHSDSRRLYSWLWDSHNSPRNSKWLQENLADMDAKVKQMIKLITEDADSFARRAEMYYKKRPELMKLVEELYRAYRALAERYDHVTVELRHAHRTIAEAFPDQVPCLLADQLPSTSSHSDAETLKLEFPNSFCVLVDNIDSHAVRKNSSEMTESDFWRSKKGLKQLSEMLESGAVPQNSKFPEGKIRKGCLNLKPQVLPESEHYYNVKTELQNLKNSLAKIQAEKEEILYKHQETLRKLAEFEKELHNAQDDAGELDDQASRAEIEINILKEALAKLVSEKDASLMQYNQCMEKISNLESIISRIQEDAKGIDDQNANAEIEAVIHKGQFSKLEAEKEALLLQYKQCLEQISALEIKVLCAENDAGMLYGQIERAESEVTMLKEAVSALTEEKETTALQYKRCLETIALLEAERSHAQEEVKELHDEIKTGSAKLRSSEEKCLLLEKSNQSLQKEADDLSQDIELRDQELVKMQLELGKLQTLLQDEHLRFVQVEATLHVLQQLQTQSEEEQRTLTLELKNDLQNDLQMLKDLEICNQKLEKEITRVMEENRSLNEENFSSNLSLSNLQNEITSLKEIKIKLEQDFIEKVEHSNTIQKEISSLKEEMKSLDKSYRALILQVESVGLNPVTLPSSVKELQDENIQLKKMCEKEKEECMVLAEKLQNMDKVLDKNAVMESSISELNFLLQVSKEKIRELQESCQLHQGEKANLVAEKATLLSQLQIMTENMKKLLEKNTVLEKTLSSANTELGILKEKLKGLEEFCKLLSSEKSSLLDERSFLVSRLEDLELRLGKLERRFTNLEENHAALEKEKESIIFHVEELWSLLSMEKKLHADYVYSTEARLTGMEGHIHYLQRENTLKKEEFEEELRKTISAEVEVFILLKFIQDLEEKNLSLAMECQKHIEASKLSDNLIFELEGENFEQEVEVENLLNVIEKLGSGIQQIYRALQADPITAYENKNEQEELQFPCILNNIEDMKSSLWKSEDEKYQLLVENMILLTLIEQQGLGVAVLKSEKNILEEELRVAGEQHAKFRKTEHELMDINRELMLDARNGEELEKKLKNELKNLNLKLVDLQQSYLLLLNENSKTIEENKLLLEKFSELKKEKHVLEEESSIIMQDTVALSNTSLVLEVFGAEKAAEFKSLVKDFNSLQKINSDINIELEELHQRLKLNEIEHLHLNDTVETLNKIISGMADFNSDLNIQMGVLKDSLIQKEIVLAEAEQKHKDTQKLNFALSRSVEDLKSQHEGSRLINEDLEKHIFELSKENKIQSKEIERLHGLNTTLESEVAMLQEENNRHMLKEESLCLELQDKEHEFELWEADATTFYFDLQISVFHEVLLQNKLKELGEICENLECKNSVKTAEIEQMKSIINSLESEIGGLKAQLSNYVPVIASLRDDVASLENNAQNWTKLRLAGNEGRQPSELTQGSKCQKLLEDSSVIPLGISDLEIMQTRIRTVLKSMEKVNDGNTNFKIEAATARAGKLKLRDSSHSDVEKYREGGNGVNNMIKIGKNEFENFEARDGILMKDIQLDRVSDYLLHSSSRGSHGRADDHMLELWETSEQDLIVREAHKQSSASMGDDVLRLSKNSRHRRRVPSLELQAEKELGIDKLELSSTLKETYHEGNKRKFLEKIASDSQILMTLLPTIEELRKRMDRLKRSKKAKDVEYEIVRTRLQEAEEAVLHLAAMEDKLKKDVSEPHLSWYGGTTAELEQSRNVPRTVTEQAREQSEKIAQLQLDMQNIQQFLQKLEIESKSKGNDRFSGSRTGIFLREFILSGNRTSKKRKKFRFCGCVRPSSVKK